MLSKIFKREKGITLVALAVTIIVLIILASIGINLAFSDNGIIKEAQNAKESAEIDEEQGILKRAITISLIKSTGTNIEQSVLEKALNDEIGEGKTEVSDFGEGFEVMFTESNRYYEIDEEGKIGEVQYFVKDEYAGDITKGGRCDGSEEKPYEISCIEDLVVLSNMSNGTGIKFENGEAVEVTRANNFEGKYIILAKSLNFQSKYSYADSTRTDFGDINGDDTDGNMLITEMTTGTGFQGIGLWKSPFQGVFDGKENSILNIYINDVDYGGLFSHLAGGAYVSNITIAGRIEARECVGGIAGETSGNNGKIILKNCVNRAHIIGSPATGTGGIIGYMNNGEIEECENYGEISEEAKPSTACGVGGIIGVGGETIINKCINYGSVVEADTKAGGIIGISSGENSIMNSINLGKIEGTKEAGGIVGNTRFKTLNIINSANCGNVIGENSGGLIGGTAGGSWSISVNVYIHNCFNSGKIECTNGSSGGIIGMQTTISLTNEVYMYNVYNIGNIVGKTTGNIIGKIELYTGYGEIKTEMYNVYCMGNAIGNGSLTGGEVTQIADSEIKNASFVELLNSYTDDTGVYPTNWKKWKMGDKGYPVFED